MIRATLGVLVVVLLGCADGRLGKPTPNVLTLKNGQWIPLDAASLTARSPAIAEFWEVGGVQSYLRFSVRSGQCEVSPSELVLEAGGRGGIEIVCSDAGVIVAEFEGRSAVIFVEITDAGDAGLAMDAGLDAGTCRYRRIRFGDAYRFAPTEPGTASRADFRLLVEEGELCIAEVSNFGDESFRIKSTASLIVDALGVGRSRPISVGELLDFGVEFSPLAFNLHYQSTIRLPQGTDGLTLDVVGLSPPKCPQNDAGCPIAQHAIYLSTLDSLYLLDGGSATKVADFSSVDEAPDGIKDIAILPDGTMYALGISLYLVDPSTGVMRRWLDLNESYTALESMAANRLLVGGETGVSIVDLESGAIAPAPSFFSMPVSGDIASQTPTKAFVSVRNVVGADSIYSLDLQSGAATLMCDAGRKDIWGLTYRDSRLTGVTGHGEMIEFDDVSGTVISIRGLPGIWTGASSW